MPIAFGAEFTKSVAVDLIVAKAKEYGYYKEGMYERLMDLPDDTFWKPFLEWLSPRSPISE